MNSVAYVLEKIISSQFYPEDWFSSSRVCIFEFFIPIYYICPFLSDKGNNQSLLESVHGINPTFME